MIENTLKDADKAMGRAGFLVVTMITKRKLRREWLVEAVEKLEQATTHLKALLAAKKEEA
jgi:hypothetical protein